MVRIEFCKKEKLLPKNKYTVYDAQPTRERCIMAGEIFEFVSNSINMIMIIVFGYGASKVSRCFA